MDERVKEILGTDIDEVVAQGEKSGSKRKIAVVIIVFVALVVGVLGYFINRDAKYKDALHMADIGLYDDAVEEFSKLGNYKDSQDNVQKIIEAKEFAESSCYQRQYELIKNSFSSVSADIVVYLEWKTMTVVTQITLPEGTNPTAEDLKSDAAKELGVLPVFLSFFRSADNACTVLKNTSEDEGYSVNYRTEITGYDGCPLYTTLNGEETFACIDMSEAWDEVYAKCYNEIVSMVNQGDYATACKVWETFNSNELYELDYKDISDYYYYAKAMKAYKGNGEINLTEVEANLAKVSSGFKDTESIKNTIKDKIDAVSGTYINAGKYRVFLSGNKVEVSLPYETCYSFAGNNGTYTFENGEITSVKATLGNSYTLEATFNGDGLMVTCTRLQSSGSWSYFSFHDYSKLVSGQYSFESTSQVYGIY